MKALHLVLAAVLVVSAGGTGLSAGGTAPGPSAAGSTDRPAPTTGPSAPGGRTVAQVDRPSSPPRTVNALGGRRTAPNRTAFTTAYVDLGPALDAESSDTSHRLQALRAVERVEGAGTDAERTARLRAELRAIEERADDLGRTQGRVIEEYVDERRTAEELVVALAAVDREARALDDRRKRLWRLANRTDAVVPDGRFVALGSALDAYRGPARARAAAVLAGEAPPGRFYVAAAPRSVVLATLTDDAYLREAYRGDLRRIGDDELSGRDAGDAVAAGYPDVWNAGTSVATEPGRIASVRVDYPGGRLDATVGSANRRVFADAHRRSLDAVGTNETALNTRDGIRMLVNRSYPGGAMRVELRDTAGNRVNASVTVGPAGGQSATVGHTGDDGELWLLTPGERFTVVAIRDQSVVFLTMSPLATPDPGTDRTEAGG